jgi:hypothetical protein
MNTILIACAVYLVSVMAMYSWVRIAHSEGGYRVGKYIGTMAIWIVFIPLVNTVASIMGWVFFHPLDKEQKELNLEKFFQIK